MNAKIFTFVLLTSFLLLASSFVVSAGTISQPFTSTTESISIPNATVSTISSITLENAQSVTPTASVSANGLTLTINAPAINYVNVLLGKIYSGSILLVNATTNDVNQTIPVSITKTYCSNGTSANTTRRFEITSVKDTTSDNDWEWKPADEVTVAVKVKFYNDADSDDSVDGVIKVELYDSVDNVFIDLDNEDDFERDISLDEGSSTTEDFVISVPIEDLVDSSDRYKLYVKVYEDGKETSTCKDNWNSQYSQNVQIQKNSYDVILKDLEVSSSSVPCGQELTITGTAINVGSNDEDKVYIGATNVQLKVNLSTTSFALDEGDSNKFSFTFMIPANASEKTYIVYLESHFKYSDSSERYREESDVSEVEVKVEGCVAPVTASVTAQLNSETPKAVIGKQVVVDATVKNTGTIAATYTVTVSGNTAWSSVAEIDPKTITLDAGEEGKVSIYLDINADVEESDKTFTIKTTAGTYSTEKSVQLALVKGFTTDAIVNHLKEKWYIYAIALVNLILIIAIILAIVSLSRRKA
ncbi:MAG: putative S-layer protein [archaeon]|nr:putative S-layer protein [archaeon]